MRKFLFTWAFWILTQMSCVFGQSLCGTTSTPKNNNNDQPWLVVLEIYFAGETSPSFCAGSLVATKWVMTAAHCVQDSDGNNAALVNAYPGKQNGVINKASEKRLIEVAHIGVHPDFMSSDDGSYSNDFALLQLSKDANLNPSTRLVCIQEEPCPSTCQELIAVGWPLTAESSFEGKTLTATRANLTVRPQTACGVPGAAGQMCVSSTSSRSSTPCVVTSGGPVLCKMTDGKYYLSGVISDGQNCGTNDQPTVYNRVCSVSPWVQSIILSQTTAPTIKTTTEAPTCSVPETANGQFEVFPASDSTDVPRGTRITLTCSDGYVTDGAETSDCLGDWLPMPGQCVPDPNAASNSGTPPPPIFTASSKQCFVPSEIVKSSAGSLNLGSEAINQNAAGRQVAVNNKLTLTCKSPARLLGSGTATCQADGSWAPSIGRCISLGGPTATRAPETRTPVRTRATATPQSSSPTTMKVSNSIDVVRSARARDYDEMKRYIEQGGDVNSKDSSGATALIVVAGQNNSDIANYLLARPGCNVNAQDSSGYTALIVAARASYTRMIGLLLTNAANIDAKDNDGWTALAHASQLGLEPVVSFLISKGATVDAKDNDGWTPLHRATNARQAKIVELLLAGGANINAKTNSGQTALIMSSRPQKTAIFYTLLNKGADKTGCGVACL